MVEDQATILHLTTSHHKYFVNDTGTKIYRLRKEKGKKRKVGDEEEGSGYSMPTLSLRNPHLRANYIAISRRQSSLPFPDSTS